MSHLFFIKIGLLSLPPRLEKYAVACKSRMGKSRESPNSPELLGILS